MAIQLAAIPLLGKALAALKGGTAAVGAAKGAGFLKSMAPIAAKTKAAVTGMPGTASKLVGGMPGAGAKRMAGDALTKAKNIQFLKDNYGIDVGGTVKEVMNKASGLNPTAGLNMADDAGIFDRIKRGVTSLDGFKKNIGVPMTKDDILMTVAPDLMFGGLAALTTEGDIVDKAIAGIGSAGGGIVGGIGARGVLGPKSGLGVLATEMGGGIAGDMIGMNVANGLIRAKNGGMTPQEEMYMSQDQAYQQQIIDSYLAQNGLG